MDRIEDTRLWHTVTELTAAIESAITFDVFNHPSGLPKNAEKMETPISLVATSYFDYGLMRMVEISEDTYGVSCEGQFAERLIAESRRWLFRLMKISVLERVGLTKPGPRFNNIGKTPPFLRPYAPWQAPKEDQITFGLDIPKGPAGRILICVTETQALWQNVEQSDVPIATSVYLLRANRDSVPRTSL